MIIENAALELRSLIQQFEAARPRVPQPQRADYDKRLRRLQAELIRLDSYDPEIDPESPDELAGQASGVVSRLRRFLPEKRAVENLSLALFDDRAGRGVMEATWDGSRWTLNPQRLAVHDVQMLAGHLSGQVCQSNDLDVWRASLLPAALLSAPWCDLGASEVQLRDQA